VLKHRSAVTASGSWPDASLAAPSPLGVRIDPFDCGAALRQLERLVEERRSAPVHFCNAWNAALATRSPAYRDILNRGALNLADGMSLIWACHMLGFPEPAERVAGAAFMTAAVRDGMARGTRHFLYGGAPDVMDDLTERLRQTAPGIRIVGRISPPYRPLEAAEERAVADEITASRADLVWVGLGTPKQDLFIERMRTQVEVGALLAVGAAFDFLAGRKSRAPLWMQRNGLEWAFRLACEPSRLAGRYLVGNSTFVLQLARQLARERGPAIHGRRPSHSTSTAGRPDLRPDA
jgi:N-acetylglucosaminyldiphosphoundecaprenol N-acetyl-beta-D-mannosaminyltransferase